MPKLGHCPSLDLTNALTSEIEVFTDLFERAGLATVKTEAQLENLSFTLVEWTQQAVDLFGEQRGSCYFER